MNKNKTNNVKTKIQNMKNAIKPFWRGVIVGASASTIIFSGLAVATYEFKPEPIVESRMEDLTVVSDGICVDSAATSAAIVEKVVEMPAPKPQPKKTQVAPQVQSPVVNSSGANLGTFKISAYCHCSQCCGKSDGITATGTKVAPNRTIAVDPNVIPLGSQVVIDGQVYVAEDTGGAIKGNRIDMYFSTHQEALNWGIRYKNVSLV